MIEMKTLKTFNPRDRDKRLRYQREGSTLRIESGLSEAEKMELKRTQKLVEVMSEDGRMINQWVEKDALEIQRTDLVSVLANYANVRHKATLERVANLKKRNSPLFAIERL